jgi:hypothetical protein
MEWAVPLTESRERQDRRLNGSTGRKGKGNRDGKITLKQCPVAWIWGFHNTG